MDLYSTILIIIINANELNISVKGAEIIRTDYQNWYQKIKNRKGDYLLSIKDILG